MKQVTLTRWQIGSSIGIVLIGALTTLLAILTPGIYDEIPVYQSALYLQDLILLGIAFPTLLVGLWLAVGGSRRGEIIWLGSLVFMVYIWASQAFVLAYNDLLILHIVLLALAAGTLVHGVLHVDATAYKQMLAGRLPRRLYIAFFGLTALALGVMWLSELVEPLLSGGRPPGVEQFGPLSKNTTVLDLGFVVPSLGLTAVWLYRDRAWAYPIAGMLVVFGALLAPGIASMTVTLASGGIQITTVALVASIVPPVLGAIVAVRFLLAIPRRKRGEPADRTGVPG